MSVNSCGSRDPLRLPDTITTGEKYFPAMEVQTKEEADEYLNACIEHSLRRDPSLTPEKARQLELDNIGYFAGYEGIEKRGQMEELYGCKHPIMGSLKQKGVPTCGQTFAMGQMYGKVTTTLPGQQLLFLLDPVEYRGFSYAVLQTEHGSLIGSIVRWRGKDIPDVYGVQEVYTCAVACIEAIDTQMLKEGLS